MAAPALVSQKGPASLAKARADDRSLFRAAAMERLALFNHAATVASIALEQQFPSLKNIRFTVFPEPAYTDFTQGDTDPFFTERASMKAIIWIPKGWFRARKEICVLEYAFIQTYTLETGKHFEDNGRKLSLDPKARTKVNAQNYPLWHPQVLYNPSASAMNSPNARESRDRIIVSTDNKSLKKLGVSADEWNAVLKNHENLFKQCSSGLYF